jgi:hypothetical protein
MGIHITEYAALLVSFSGPLQDINKEQDLANPEYFHSVRTKAVAVQTQSRRG